MLAVIATIRIRPGLEPQFIDIFAARRRRVLREEPETLEYTLYRSASEPVEFTVVERFPSMDGHRAHLANSTDHEPMMACFDGPPVVQFVTGVDGAC